MKKLPLIFVLLCILTGTLAACKVFHTISPTPSPMITPSPAIEQKWEAQGIASYSIRVVVVRSIWHAQTYQIKVWDNKVESASASCIPSPMEDGNCEVESFNAEDYIVPGLFAKARDLTQSQYAQWSKITYDPIYGFPNLISYANPNIVDGDWSWKVINFEIIK